MPDNKTTTTASGSGVTSSTGAKFSSAGASSSTAAGSSAGAAAGSTTTTATSASTDTSNTAALSEMIYNCDPDLLLCLVRGEVPRDRTRRSTRWYEKTIIDRTDCRTRD